MKARIRQDAIVRRLRRNGTCTIDALAEEVGASRRTVSRDIRALRDEGLAIHADAGRGGGLQLDPQSMQTTARLSVAEVFALLISVAAMRAGGALPFLDLADAGLAKIEKSLPADKVKDLRAFLDCLHSGGFRQVRTCRTWVGWTGTFCRRSRRPFSSAPSFASTIAMRRGGAHGAKSSRRRC